MDDNNAGGSAVTLWFNKKKKCLHNSRNFWCENSELGGSQNFRGLSVSGRLLSRSLSIALQQRRRLH